MRMDTEKLKAKASSRWQWLAGSTFILSLLLVGTVSALVYIQLRSGCAGPTTQPDVRETIHLVDTEKNPLGDETITFSKGESIVVYTGDDGSFNLQDYGKGLHITNIKGTNKCVVAAVELGNATYENFEEILQSTRGRNVTMKKEEGNFHINQGTIEDTSFISSRAHKHCTEGYHWMVQLPMGTSRLPGRPGDIDGDVQHDLVKRQAGQPGPAGQPGAGGGGVCITICAVHSCGCMRCVTICGSCGCPGSPGQPGAPGQ